MRSFRAYSLVALAAAGLALSALVAVAQPADPPAQPKPGDAPRGPGGAGQPGQPGQPGDGGVRGRPQPGRRGGDESMVPANSRQAMSVMNRAIRTLKGQVSDAAKKDENLKLVSDMQRGCLGAKGAAPDKVLARETEQAKKDATTTQYRKGLIKLMEKLLALETALIDGKSEDAAKLLADVEKIRDDAHNALGVQD